LPPDSPEPALAAYLLLEYSQWYYSKPFEELPAETADQIKWLLSRQVPFRLSVMQEILHELRYPPKR